MVGAVVSCEDGECGEPQRVLVDPAVTRDVHLSLTKAQVGSLPPVDLQR
ncbi:MAG: hypothetical protein ACYCSX_08300 [Acidimicrobiales bacterium]|jgi:hypothetical protein